MSDADKIPPVRGDPRSVSNADGPRRLPPNPAPIVPEDRIDGDMTTEEPLGWDQAPQDIKNPRQKRHPRTGGKGGSDPSERR